MRRLILLLAAVAGAFGQTSSNGITVGVSFPLASQPDQVWLLVTVNTGLDQTLDQVVAVLKGTGIAAGDLTEVRSQDGLSGGSGLIWTFQPVVSFSDLSRALAALAALEASNSNVGFYIVGSTTSPAAAAAEQCPYAALIQDARAQAAKLAAAAGMTAGPVLSITGEQAGYVSLVVPNPLATSLTGTLATTYWSRGASSTPSCAFLVQFQLGM